MSNEAPHREIELRFEVDERIWRDVQTELFAHEEPTRHSQEDWYFDRPGLSFVAELPVREWVRLRAEDDRVELNRKVFEYPDGSDIATHAIEYHHDFDSLDSANEVLEVLGYRPLVTVTKERMTYRSINGVEVSFDLVRHLGYFIEIEAISQDDSIGRVMSVLEAAASRVGVPMQEQDRRGYPFMLLQRSGVFDT